MMLIFQSTLPRGERQEFGEVWELAKEFQSTLPRGERHYLDASRTAGNLNFNPRSREGSDILRASARVLLFFYFNPRYREGSDDCS